MAIGTPIFAAGTAFTFTLLTAGQAPAAQDAAPLVLHVDNYARVPPEHLEQSRLEVTRIFKAAGIETIWVEGDGQAGPASRKEDSLRAAVHLRVLLLCQEMAERKIAREAISDNVLGRAARPTGRAYILTHRVADFAARRRRDFDRLLGRVIAHEVGHLLLAPGSHSPSGIMRGRLDSSSSSVVSFTGAQRKEMRTALQTPN